MKKLGFLLIGLFLLAAAGPAMAVDLSFHGDLNNRFLLYTNHQDWLNPEQDGILEDDTIDAYYGELKYRFWFDAADDNGNVKGVYAIEIGGIRYGEGTDGDFSGDGVDVETRWAYLDMQTPGVERKMRWRMGLQPWAVNEFFWQETATGLQLYGDITEAFDYTAAWIRPLDRLATSSADDDLEDLDILYGRLNWDSGGPIKIGVFGTYFHSDNGGTPGTVGPRDWLVKNFDDQASFDFYTVGLDGGAKFDAFFFSWDFKYQGGDIDDLMFDPNAQAGDSFVGAPTTTNWDLNAWFAALEAGVNVWGSHTFTYTFWYASGDDDPDDDDFEGYLAVDLDRTDSIAIFEGLYTDDSSYFTERPYMLDKGFIMNKLGWDWKINPKLTVGAAGMYMMTAEDVEYTNFNGGNESNSDIGFELQGYLKYMLWTNVEFKINAGYLWSGDAMDAFETGADRDGSADEDIFGSSFRIRYKF